MITVETYADLPRKLGHHAFVILALLQAAEMMGERPVTAQWLYDRAPGYGINSITAALRKLTSVEVQLAIHVTGGWQLNREGAFQLPLGYVLADGQNHSESDSDVETIEDEPNLVSENHSESDSASQTGPEILSEDGIETPCDNKNHSQSDSCILEPPENHSKSDSHTRFPLKTLKTPKSLIKVVVGGENLNLIPPPPDLSGGGKNETEWAVENKKMLDASALLFGEGFFVVTRGLDLETIPPVITRGWLNQAYFLMSKGSITSKIAAGTVYNRLREYPSDEKPKPTFLHAEADAYLPDDYLVEIGVKRKPCELCEETFDSLAAYQEHFTVCLLTYRDDEAEREPVPLEPDESIPEQVLQIWEVVIDQIKQEMPKVSFDTWVRDLQPVRLVDRRLIVAVRNKFARDWLTDRLTGTFERLLGEMSVEFVVG